MKLQLNHIYQGDASTVLELMPASSIHCCVTSPPYWGLRDYQVDGQLGLEKTPEEYIEKMVAVFRGVWRVLRDDGTLWLNMGDCYAGSMKGMNPDGTWSGEGKESSKKQASNKGSVGLYVPDWNNINLKPKDLCMMPARLALALQADGWWIRCDIIWQKPNPMPESVTDRPTKSHEYLFLLTKKARYYYDADAVRERSIDPESHKGRRSRGPKAIFLKHGYAPGMSPQSLDKGNPADGRTYKYRNRRSVWTIPTSPFPQAHFATFPPKLVEPCVLAGTKKGGIVLDPFMGAGTTALVAKNLGRKYVGIELSAEYIRMANTRLKQEVLEL